MSAYKPGSLDALLYDAFMSGYSLPEDDIEPDEAFDQWRTSLGPDLEGVESRIEPIHLLERGNRKRTVCEIDIDGLFRNPEVTWTLAQATCPVCLRGRAKGCFS